jgi:hypothetical protein
MADLRHCGQLHRGRTFFEMRSVVEKIRKCFSQPESHMISADSFHGNAMKGQSGDCAVSFM